MASRIFNTLSRRKEDFVPVVPGEVRVYVCGVTVYDLCHIGHARSAIVFDIIRRYLRFRGFAVTFVKNYTDVDDKIIQRANEEGVTASAVSERYIAEYQTDMASIGVAPADVEPKATEHIPQMIALIQRLIARGVAYALEGDVYFEVRRFPAYGKLSGKNLDELESGARVDVNERKRDPLDFALWKASKPGEPSWPSPWGPGRPGWHIECSAMAMQYLGETFDLHGGGEDLIFPHHENEIAQTEGGDREALRALLGPQRLRQPGHGEDVEVPRQHAPDQGHGAPARSGGAPALFSRYPLSPSPGIRRRTNRGIREGARPVARSRGRSGAGGPRGPQPLAPETRRY